MNKKTYLIIGGTGGIGKAMVEQLIQMTHKIQTGIAVFATYHNSVPEIEADNLYWLKMDISDEDSIKQSIDAIKTHSNHIDWVINCVGLLHTEHNKPEKALRQMQTEFFYRICRSMHLPACSLPNTSSRCSKTLSVVPIIRRYLRRYQLESVVSAIMSLAAGTATV